MNEFIVKQKIFSRNRFVRRGKAYQGSIGVLWRDSRRKVYEVFL